MAVCYTVRGHTEAGCDLTRLAGLEPAAVICEIIKEDGEMARRDDLEILPKNMAKIGTIADLINYRIANEQTVEAIANYPMQTEFGEFTAYRFKEKIQRIPIWHWSGQPSEGVSTVRVHSFQPLRDLFTVQLPNSGKSNWDIHASLKEISQSERGVFVWIGHQQTIDMGERSITLSLTNPTHRLNTNPTAALGLAHRFYVIWACVICVCCHHRLKFNALSGFDLNGRKPLPTQTTNSNSLDKNHGICSLWLFNNFSSWIKPYDFLTRLSCWR